MKKLVNNWQNIWNCLKNFVSLHAETAMLFYRSIVRPITL